MEPVAIGAVDGAAEVDDPSVVLDRHRGRQQHRRPGLEPEELRLGLPDGLRLDLVVGPRGTVPLVVEGRVQRRGREVELARSRQEAQRHAVVVERDRQAIEHAQPLELEHVGPGSDPEGLGLVQRRGPDLAEQHLGARLEAARAPEVREAHQRVGRLGEGVAGDKGRAPARLDKAVAHELLERPPHRRAAHAELVAQPALGWQPIPRPQGAVLDLLRDLPVHEVVQRLRGVADRHQRRLFQRCCRNVKHLVPIGMSWYVPAHGFRRYGPLGRRP